VGLQKISRYFEVLIRLLIDQDSIHGLLLSFGLDMKKLVGWSSDGCSTMLGKKGGVAKKLQRLSPWMVTFHCPAHRLDLAIGDIAKKVHRTISWRFTLMKANLRIHLSLKSNNCSKTRISSTRIPVNGKKGSNPQLHDDTRKLTNSLIRCCRK
jgi:hypothetical protein